MMNHIILKRDGSETAFDSKKIKNAILKAMKNGSGIIKKGIAEQIANEAENALFQSDNLPTTVDQVEDYVYFALLEYGEDLTAKLYEGYRTVQAFKRNINTTDESILELVSYNNKDVMEENSNKNARLASTQRDLIAGEVSKDISRRVLIPAEFVQAHDEGIIHWHDMDYSLQPIFNCCLLNLEDMLDNGTVINEKLVESPNSFATACTITTQIIAQVSSGQYGGQSITIKHLAKYLRRSRVRYYKLLKETIKDAKVLKDTLDVLCKQELKDGIQTIRYQLSTLQTSNGQSPFCTIYLEVEVGDPYEEECAAIIEEMLHQRITGMKNVNGQEIGEAFPKLVYLLDEDNCLEGGKYDYLTKLAAECTAKRLVPDYQSKLMMMKNYEGEYFPPMGCRSHLSPWKDENGKYKWYGRFNQGVVSINLPQIGILAKEDPAIFWDLLDERLDLCKRALLKRHELLKGTLSDVSPIHWQHGAIARLKPGEKIDKYLMNGYSTLSLGYVGIHEMVQALIGESHTTKKGEQLAVAVMEHLNNKCKEWKAETGLGFSLYGTPAESLVYRFCRLDKERFGEIPNVTDKLYYTNSYHVNVREEIDAFDKLKFESQFHDISLGGCISYIETPNLVNNTEAIEDVIRYGYRHIQYFEINSRPDVCYKCGYRGEMQINENLEWYCPCCGNNDQNQMQVMRRTCGYIGSSFWNKGKTQEIKERVFHL